MLASLSFFLFYHGIALHMKDASLKIDSKNDSQCIWIENHNGAPSSIFHAARSGCTCDLPYHRHMLFASLPRSGNSWIATFLVNATGSCIGHISPLPVTGGGKLLDGSLMEKTHYPAMPDTEIAPHSSDVAHVWLVRNPWDATWSAKVEHAAQNISSQYKQNKSYDAELLRDWYNHTKFWHGEVQKGLNGEGPPIFMVRYEDALVDPVSVVEQIVNFLWKVRDPSGKISKVNRTKLDVINENLACANIGAKCSTGIVSYIGAHSECWNATEDESGTTKHGFTKKLQALAAELGYHRKNRTLHITEPSGVLAKALHSQVSRSKAPCFLGKGLKCHTYDFDMSVEED